jgi:CRISPR-associated exonuclease Cas4
VRGETISASDLERFGYCPLSWWLGMQSDVTSDALEEGEKRHEMVSNNLSNILIEEKRARSWERWILIFSVVATVLGLVGLSSIGFVDAELVSAILAVLAIIWIVAAIFLLFRSASIKDKKKSASNEQIVVGFAIIAMIIALNAVTVLQAHPDLARLMELGALVLLIVASFAMYRSLASSLKAKKKREEGAIEGDIRYVGMESSRLLKSERYGLTGRPDYILERNGEIIPIEVKSGRKPKGPLFSHVLQVAAYCLLLDEEGGKVSHGILRYGDMEHEVEFDAELRSILLGKLKEMRRLMGSGDVHRNHHRPGKCHSCSRREMCPERLE